MKNPEKVDWDLWNFQKIEQIHNSKITSINGKLMPATVKIIEHLFVSGQKWADIGGGRFDNAKDYLAQKGVTLHIYDPFNRSYEENMASVQAISNAQCDGVMVNNVLNVIEEKTNRRQVIEQAFNTLKDNGFAFFKIHEGDGKGVSRVLTKGENTSFQLNQKAKFYLDEIKAVFGSKISTSGNLIIVQKSLTLDNLEDLIKESKKVGVPQRSVREGVGKLMGENLYIHRHYEAILPEGYVKAKAILNEHAPSFEFNIIKYNRQDNSVSFICSPDFDTSSEPIVGDIIRVSGTGEIKYLKQKTDPQIYHHKWNFVKNDYPGFSVKQSIERSIQWKSEVGNNKEISSRIGTKSFWERLGK